MGRVAQTPLAAVGLLTPAPRSAATTAHRLLAVGGEAPAGRSVRGRSPDLRPRRRALQIHWEPMVVCRRARLARDASTFGGQFPQRTAEVCPLPTRIALL
jgi:hypothetical protein